MKRRKPSLANFGMNTNHAPSEADSHTDSRKGFLRTRKSFTALIGQSCFRLSGITWAIRHAENGGLSAPYNRLCHLSYIILW